MRSSGAALPLSRAAVVAVCAFMLFVVAQAAHAGSSAPNTAAFSTAPGERLVWVGWDASSSGEAGAAASASCGELLSALRGLPAELLITTGDGFLVRVPSRSRVRLEEVVGVAREAGVTLHVLAIDPAAVGLDAASAAGSGEGRPRETALYVVHHRADARPAGNILYESRHVALLTAGGAEAEALSGEDAFIVRVTPYAKPWRAAAQAVGAGVQEETGSAPAGEPLPGTPFHPLISGMVSGISQQNYGMTLAGLVAHPTRYTYSAWCDSAAQHVHDQFASLGLAVEFHHYSSSGPRVQVVATLPGIEHPEEVVYVSGHLDDTSELRYTDAPGADDDGSGTAAVLEIARVLRNYAFSRTIKFVTFTGEEQGLLGSAAYVQSIFAAGEDVVADFQMDMIGWSGTDPLPPDLVIYTNTASQALAYRWQDAILQYMPTRIEPVVLVDPLGASDHASFWDYGYLAVLGIEDEAWGDDFNPYYHTSNDDIGYVDMAYAANVTRTALAVVADYAGPLYRTSVAGAGADAESGGASALRILSLGPNPMHGGNSAVTFALGEAAPVRAEVFDLTGRRVRTLLDETRAAGVQGASWDGRDAAGHDVASGLYFVRVSAGDASETGRLLLVR